MTTQEKALSPDGEITRGGIGMESSELESNVKKILRNTARQGRALKTIMLSSGTLLLIFGIISLAVLMMVLTEIGTIFSSLSLDVPSEMTIMMILALLIDLPVILAGIVLLMDGLSMKVDTTKKKERGGRPEPMNEIPLEGSPGVPPTTGSQ